MQAFHIPGAAPLYTNTFLLISDAGHAVVIDPAADAQTYDKILKEHHVPSSPPSCAPTATTTMWAAPKPCAPSGTQSSTVRLPTLQATACIR